MLLLLLFAFCLIFLHIFDIFNFSMPDFRCQTFDGIFSSENLKCKRVVCIVYAYVYTSLEYLLYSRLNFYLFIFCRIGAAEIENVDKQFFFQKFNKKFRFNNFFKIFMFKQIRQFNLFNNNNDTSRFFFIIIIIIISYATANRMADALLLIRILPGFAYFIVILTRHQTRTTISNKKSNKIIIIINKNR